MLADLGATEESADGEAILSAPRNGCRFRAMRA
jgi:hypothetical protein